MSALTYRPLYAGVFALQLVAVVAIAYVAVPSPWSFPFALTWAVALGASLAVGYWTRHRSRGWTELLPLATGAAVILPWLLIVGSTLAHVVLGLALLAGRNATLSTRRALYFDLAVVAAAFYVTLSAKNLAVLSVIGVAFLVALVFVLMADYSDRRLAYVRADDAAAHEALAPSLRNTALATTLVLALGALIYALLPQPGPRELATYDADARNRADTRGERSEGKSAGAHEDSGKGPSETSGDEDRKPVRPQQSGPQAEAPSDKAGEPPRPGDALARLDISRSSGPEPSAGRGGGEGNTSRPGGPESPGQSQEPGRLKTDSLGHGLDSDSNTKSAGKPKAGDEPHASKRQQIQVTDEPQPLVLLYLDAEHPVYVRTHSYVRPSESDWSESEEAPVRTPGLGSFVIATLDDRDAFVQRYRINTKLGPRIPAVHRAVRLTFPASLVSFTPDFALRAPSGLEPGMRYTVISSVQYAGQRLSGGFELDPPSSGYRALPARMSPRVIELTESLARGKSAGRERAEALEAYLRAQYRRGGFDSAGGDPTETFIFVQRQGGSEQFASALGLMLRAAGIPSRIAGGFRARRLNPLHGDFELWAADRHYWVEAYVDDRWTIYEPSPWAPLPARRDVATSWEAAKEYVRLAKRDDSGVEVLPPHRPSDSYLRLVLAWGWVVTYGPWILLGLVLAALVAWQQRRWLRPWFDSVDLIGVRRGDPRARILAAYGVVEKVFARRDLAREPNENHDEFVRRIAVERPQVARPLSSIADAFAVARYGARAPRPAVSERAVLSCRAIVDLIDEIPERGRQGGNR